MHDIWNPWHGCVRKSEGCDHCYMFYNDASRGRDGSVIYRTVADFDLPLQKDRTGAYKIQSGETLRVCMNSDFFLPEADQWREEAWEMMRRRPDVIFFLLTKRPERVLDCLPKDFGDGREYAHIFMNVSAENQHRADERIPILLSLPFRHKGVMCAPMIGPVDLEKYLADGEIVQILCDGENYGGARVCDYAWVKNLYDQCVRQDVRFCFCGIGNLFRKDGKLYRLNNHRLQSEMARKSGLFHTGRPFSFPLHDMLGFEILPEERYVPHFRERCEKCGSRPICNGCSDCGACDKRDRNAAEGK